MMTALNADTLSVVHAPYPPRPEHNGGSGSRVVDIRSHTDHIRLPNQDEIFTLYTTCQLRAHSSSQTGNSSAEPG